MRTLLFAGGLCLATTVSAVAAPLSTTPPDSTSRIERLEQRVRRLEAARRSSAPKSANAFNPAVSAVLTGNVWGYGRNPDDYRLAGFQLSDEAGPAAEGGSLDESELTLQANVDDRLYGQFTTSLSGDASGTDVSVEEAYVDAVRLPAGLGMRFGRFFSAVAYLNTFHAHAWDFADAPLAYRAFLGDQLGDDGVQLCWIAPTDLFVEVGGEALRGAAFPAEGGHGATPGMWDLFLHLGGDVGVSHSWRLGLGQLWADPRHRAAAIGPASTFTGDSDLTVADLVWKWAPNGNPYRHNALFQAGYFHREERGLLEDDAGGAGAVAGRQDGIYLQTVYQFLHGWRAGVRYDWLSGDLHGDASLLATTGLDGGHDPERATAMVDYSHSEFSRLRSQVAWDRSRPATDVQWTLQYIVALGAHGAHAF